MRAAILCLCLAAGALAQPKELSFQQVTGGVFAGFSEDAKAEKVWEAAAQQMRPGAKEGQWEMREITLRSFRDGRPLARFVSPSGVMTPAARAARRVTTPSPHVTKPPRCSRDSRSYDGRRCNDRMPRGRRHVLGRTIWVRG